MRLTKMRSFDLFFREDFFAEYGTRCDSKIIFPFQGIGDFTQLKMGLRKEIGYTVLDLFMSVENNRNPDFVRITTYWTHKNDRPWTCRTFSKRIREERILNLSGSE